MEFTIFIFLMICFISLNSFNIPLIYKSSENFNIIKVYNRFNIRIETLFRYFNTTVNKYKTFSVLIYSYINTSGIGKTRNCMETRRPKGGVFSYNFEFSQLPRVLI